MKASADQDTKQFSVAKPRCFKRLLVISNYFPYPPTNGSALRVWALMRCLAANGHEIDLLTFGDRQELQESLGPVLRICRTVELVPHPTGSKGGNLDVAGRLAALFTPLPYNVRCRRSQPIRRHIEAWLERGQGDAILCEESSQVANLPYPSPVPVIVDNQNVEFTLAQRYLTHERNLARFAYVWQESLKLRRWEEYACNRATAVLACSAKDRIVFERLCPTVPVFVAPNVVDTDEYAPVACTGNATVLYSGGMDWYPNRDAVQFFARHILPRVRRLIPSARFVVAGRGPSDDFRRRLGDVPGLEFTGTVPDMRAEIAKATVCVVPLRIGSGTRLKILEAAAMGKPIVSTGIGAEGLDFVNGAEILLADKPVSFADATAGLLRDTVRRSALGQAARRRVEQSYGLAALRSALKRLVEALQTAVPERARVTP